MQGRSLRFWFDVMDLDGDGRFGIEDMLGLEQEKPGWYEQEKYYRSFESVWIELCDSCNVDIQGSLSVKDIERSNIGSYCFDHFILQSEPTQVNS